MSRQLIYAGRAKDIYTTLKDKNLVISVYRDQATMFNGARKETTKGKGVFDGQISPLIFTKLNKTGVTTHFVKQLSGTGQLNKEVDVVPLEVISRNVTAGSFSKRLGVKEEIKLDTPITGFYCKSDDLDDPFINDEHVKFLGIASDEDIAYTKAETRRTNDLLKDRFSQIGLNLVDFKLKSGKGRDGKVILTDKLPPDNCRLWDTEGHHIDKDVFYRDLGSSADVYKVILEKLRGLN